MAFCYTNHSIIMCSSKIDEQVGEKSEASDVV